MMKRRCLIFILSLALVIPLGAVAWAADETISGVKSGATVTPAPVEEALVAGSSRTFVFTLDKDDFDWTDGNAPDALANDMLTNVTVSVEESSGATNDGVTVTNAAPTIADCKFSVTLNATTAEKAFSFDVKLSFGGTAVTVATLSGTVEAAAAEPSISGVKSGATVTGEPVEDDLVAGSSQSFTFTLDKDDFDWTDDTAPDALTDAMLTGVTVSVAANSEVTNEGVSVSNAAPTITDCKFEVTLEATTAEKEFSFDVKLAFNGGAAVTVANLSGTVVDITSYVIEGLAADHPPEAATGESTSDVEIPLTGEKTVTFWLSKDHFTWTTPPGKPYTLAGIGVPQGLSAEVTVVSGEGISATAGNVSDSSGYFAFTVTLAKGTADPETAYEVSVKATMGDAETMPISITGEVEADPAFAISGIKAGAAIRPAASPATLIAGSSQSFTFTLDKTHFDWVDDDAPAALTDAMLAKVAVSVTASAGAADQGVTVPPLSIAISNGRFVVTLNAVTAGSPYSFDVKLAFDGGAAVKVATLSGTVQSAGGNTGSDDDDDDSGGGGGGGGGGGYADPATYAENTYNPWLRGSGGSLLASTPVSAFEVKDATEKALEQARETGGSTAAVRLQNPGEISLENMQGIASATGMPTLLQADSMNGSAVDVRMQLDPAAATQDINLSASTTNARAAATRATFANAFGLENLTVASLSHKGEFGTPVTVMVKAASIDFIYLYNPETNTYTQIIDPNAFIDANGYAHVTIHRGGDLIFSGEAI